MRVMPARSSTTTALSGRHALVTGASSGLGADFARELAGRGAGLTLVARREYRLRALQRELAAAGADVRVVALDLNELGAPDRLAAGAGAHGRPVDVLVNNAGFGLYGPFIQLDWERERAMLKLDMIVPVHLTKLFLPGMLDRRAGWVLNIASIGAYQPSPLYASYSAAASGPTASSPAAPRPPWPTASWSERHRVRPRIAASAAPVSRRSSSTASGPVAASSSAP
jgi:short-subunit dehydrogenase